MTLDIQPLEAIVTGRQTAINRWHPNDRRMWYRALARRTITELQADRICIRYLGLQPELIWPELGQVY